MRFLILLPAVLLLAACTEASASRIDARTFRIQGPEMSVVSDAPNRRLASRLCPDGYRVLNQTTQAGGPDRATSDTDRMAIWTIRCI